MSPKPSRPRRPSIEREEEKAWVDFYRRIKRDTALAAEVLAQLNRDPELLRGHLALFLSCKESLRLDKARQARNRRIGVFVRWIMRALFAAPWRALRRTGQESRDILVEMLPETEQPPKRPAIAPPATHFEGMPAVVRRKRNPLPETHTEAESEDAPPSSRT
ncbi:MAG: hypothetical protein LBP86_11340 [Azoarcus sp.]|jgi:hypothetical protein|nr:hypothetical protein [Azoarcus sp.]